MPTAGSEAGGSGASYVFAAAELRFWLTARRAGVRHIFYQEAHHQFLERWEKAPPNLVGTLHHPPDQWGQWPPTLVRNLGRLSSVIALYRRDLERFGSLVGAGRVRFVHHGVDTEFFRPGQANGREARPSTPGERRILFAGQNGRNTRMLFRVVTRLAERRPDLRLRHAGTHEDARV